MKFIKASKPFDNSTLFKLRSSRFSKLEWHKKSKIICHIGKNHEINLSLWQKSIRLHHVRDVNIFVNAKIVTVVEVGQAKA